MTTTNANIKRRESSDKATLLAGLITRQWGLHLDTSGDYTDASYGLGGVARNKGSLYAKDESGNLHEFIERKVLNDLIASAITEFAQDINEGGVFVPLAGDVDITDVKTFELIRQNLNGYKIDYSVISNDFFIGFNCYNAGGIIRSFAAGLCSYFILSAEGGIAVASGTAVAQDEAVSFTVNSLFNKVLVDGDDYSNADDELVSAGYLESANGPLRRLAEDLLDPTGFVLNGTDERVHTMAIDDGTRTFSIDPTGVDYDIYIKALKFTISTTQSVVFDATEGSKFFYFINNAGSPQLLVTNVFSPELITEYCYVANAYWDATNSKAIILGWEDHGMLMSSKTHSYLHNTRGSAYQEGFSASVTVDASGDLDSSAQVSVTDGKFWDEDIPFNIQNSTPQTISGPGAFPVYYRAGASGAIRKATATNAPVLNFSGGSGLLAFNENVGGTWQQTEVGNGNFVLSHLLVTNNKSEPIIAIQGQNEYSTISNARAGATTEARNLELQGLAVQEYVLIATVIYQTSTSYANTWKARVRSTGDGDYVDWRETPAGIGSPSATEHNALLGRDTASAHPATAVSYDNTLSGLDSTTVKSAIDELNGMRETVDYVASETWYKIGDLPNSTSGTNRDQLQCTFFISGLSAFEKSKCDVIFSNRNGFRAHLNRSGRKYSSIKFVGYDNQDGTHSVYLSQTGYTHANYEINHINSTANTWNKELGVGSTTEPTGTKIYDSNDEVDAVFSHGQKTGVPQGSFTKVELDGTAFNSIESQYLLSNGRLLCASGNSIGQAYIWFSNDEGKKWVKAINDASGLNSIYAFKELSNGVILAGGGVAVGDLFYSLDWGLSWTRITVDSSIEFIRSIEETPSYIYLGIGLAEVAVWRTTDKTGFTGWAKYTMPSSPTTPNARVQDLKYNSTSGYLYLVGGADNSSASGHMWVCADPDAASPTFTQRTINANIHDAYTIVSQDNYIAVGTRGASSTGGLWKTTDMTGASGWAQTMSGVTAIYSSAVHSDGTVYLGNGFDASSYIYKSIKNCDYYSFVTVGTVFTDIELIIALAVTFSKTVVASVGYTGGDGDIYWLWDDSRAEVLSDGSSRFKSVQVGQARWIGEQTETPDSTSEYYPFRCGDICSICGIAYTYRSGMWKPVNGMEHADYADNAGIQTLATGGTPYYLTIDGAGADSYSGGLLYSSDLWDASNHRINIDSDWLNDTISIRLNCGVKLASANDRIQMWAVFFNSVGTELFAIPILDDLQKTGASVESKMIHSEFYCGPAILGGYVKLRATASTSSAEISSKGIFVKRDVF